MASDPDFSLVLGAAAIARAESLLHRPLFPGAPDDLPVALLLEDEEPIGVERLAALGIEMDEAFDIAVEDLEDRDAGWIERTIPVKGGGELRIAVRSGDEAGAEDALLPSALDDAAELLSAKALAVAMPAPGSLLVTDADQKWQLLAAFAAAARMYHEEEGEDGLYAGVLRAEGGRITGLIEVRTASLDAASKR
jgi:hypothetical protein